MIICKIALPIMTRAYGFNEYAQCQFHHVQYVETNDRIGYQAIPLANLPQIMIESNIHSSRHASITSSTDHPRYESHMSNMNAFEGRWEL